MNDQNTEPPPPEKKFWPRISYNAPFILTFTLLCTVAWLLGMINEGWTTLNIFSIGPGFSWNTLASYPRLILHVAGHASIEHLVMNLYVILLIGPLTEEKYGSGPLLMMALITALVTGLLNVLLFSSGLLGASGIAFMLILLSSFANVKAGAIPLTFILVMLFYLGNEFSQAFEQDNVSQFTHVIGGLCGSVFGLYKTR